MIVTTCHFKICLLHTGTAEASQMDARALEALIGSRSPKTYNFGDFFRKGERNKDWISQDIESANNL